MRRAPRGAFLLLLPALLGACASDPPGYDTPESVVHDVEQDVWFVSNINGSPLDRDGNGYIARVQPQGDMDRHWIRGGRDGVVLNAPKGLALQGDVLWVADIDVVRRFDRHSGRPLGEVVIPGATFLNDVAAAPDGTVYVSDTGLDATFAATGTDAIWRVSGDGAPVPLSKGPELGQPNGIVALDHAVYVVSWRDGTFYQIDTKGRRTDLGKAASPQLDGLVRVPSAKEGAVAPAWYATSWTGKCILRFDAGGNCSVLDGPALEQPADFCFDTRRGTFVVPLFGQNRVETRTP